MKVDHILNVGNGSDGIRIVPSMPVIAFDPQTNEWKHAVVVEAPTKLTHEVTVVFKSQLEGRSFEDRDSIQPSTVRLGIDSIALPLAKPKTESAPQASPMESGNDTPAGLPQQPVNQSGGILSGQVGHVLKVLFYL